MTADLTPLYSWFAVGLAVWLFTWGTSAIWLTFKRIVNG